MGLAPVLHCSSYRHQSVMKILVIADPWLEESQCWCISIHLTLTCSHKKGLFDHFVSSITLGEQCYLVTSRWTKYTHLLFSGPPTPASHYSPGSLKMPFLVAALFFVRACVCVIHWNYFITRMIIWCINIQFTPQSGFLNCAAEPACPLSIH